MSDYIFQYEGALRLGVFLAILTIMVLAESLWPRRALNLARPRRWGTNFLILIIDTLAIRLLFPVLAAGTAIWASANGYGLLNWLSLPIWANMIIALIALDCLIYWQHVASHKIPLLWAMHKVHHADRDIDASTALRFHPLEIALSMLFKIACVIALGAPAAAVILFEIFLNGCAIFNHANTALPQKLDTYLRRLIVTPDMHRVHHSTIERETNSNYGFCLSIWDRLFSSYTAQPQHGHEGMSIGLSEHQTQAPASLSWSLALPFGKGLSKLKNWL